MRPVSCPAEAQVRERWEALSIERRKKVMRFDDPLLVERVQIGLKDLFDTHTKMKQNLDSAGEAIPDPFASSLIFTLAFEFSFSRSKGGKPTSILAIKQSFLENPCMFDILRTVLPDLLSHSGRIPQCRPRWKDLWAVQPPSTQHMERQLVKLVEQAAWHMASDASYSVPTDRVKVQGFVPRIVGIPGRGEEKAGDQRLFQKWRSAGALAVKPQRLRTPMEPWYVYDVPLPPPPGLGAPLGLGSHDAAVDTDIGDPLDDLEHALKGFLHQGDQAKHTAAALSESQRIQFPEGKKIMESKGDEVASECSTCSSSAAPLTKAGGTSFTNSPRVGPAKSPHSYVLECD
jgi:hypothetical protein